MASLRQLRKYFVGVGLFNLVLSRRPNGKSIEACAL